jgi:hypothetical protein
VTGNDLDLETVIAALEGTHATPFAEDVADMLEILTESLDSFYDLSSSFANAVPVDILTDPVFQAIDELTETFDVAHVEARYPSALLPLVRRLGDMNIRRRSYLWYQKEKSETSRLRLEQEIPASNDCGSLPRSRVSDGTDLSTVLSSAPSAFDTPLDAHHKGTADSLESISIPPPIKTAIPPHKGPIELSLLPGAEPSTLPDVESSGGFATSSFAVTITSNLEARPRVPNPPSEFYEDRPFKWKYCCKILKVKTLRSWKYDALRKLVREIEEC